MKTIAVWFTPERRQAIQLFFGALAPLAILFGFGTDGVWEQSLILTGAVMQFASGLLSLVNVRDVATAWAIVRGAVYALAATASPALVLLGLYDERTNATILLAVSLGLGALSNLLAIFVGKQQQLDNAVRMAQDSDGTWRVRSMSAEEAPTGEPATAVVDPDGRTHFLIPRGLPGVGAEPVLRFGEDEEPGSPRT